MNKYNRILLKISGEALMGKKSFGLDANIVNKISLEIKKVYDLNIQICMVVGGGNIFRGISSASEGSVRESPELPFFVFQDLHPCPQITLGYL